MNSPSQHMDELQAQWFAIRTQFRKEKFVVSQLDAMNVEAYVPLQEVTRRYSSRIKNVQLPLIPNYAFVKITKKDYVKVLRTQGFLAFVNFSGAVEPIPESEMDTLKMIVAEEEVLKISSENLSVGDWVEIKSGNLVGMKGLLIGENGKHTFSLSLEKLGFSISILVGRHLLRKIKKAS